MIQRAGKLDSQRFAHGQSVTQPRAILLDLTPIPQSPWVVGSLDRLPLFPSSLRRFPDARVRGVRAHLPALPIEGNPLDRIKIDVFKTAGVDHVIGGIRSRTIERSDAAVAAEVVKRALGAELIRRKISLPLDEMDPIRSDHVVEVALAPADGAVAFTHAGKLSANLEPNPSAVA